jgi:hypothetical protein
MTQTTTAGTQPARVPNAWLAASAIVILTAAAAVWVRPVNHDAAWYLHVVHVWLDGGTLYRDAIDTNPPLIILLTVPPVWLARQLGVSAIPAFQLYVFALALGSIATSATLIGRTWPNAGPARRGLLLVWIAFLLLPFAKADFSQREHFAVIATMPYVLLAGMRVLDQRISPGEAVLIGAAGALGFVLKPHFVVAWIAIEAVVLWHVRRLRAWARPEALASAAVFIGYGLLVLLAFPQYFEIADRVRRVYGGIDAPALRLIDLKEVQAGVAVLLLVCLIRLPREERAAGVVAAAAGGFLAASLLQLKGWNYHLYPAQVFLALFFVVLLTGMLESAPALGRMIRGGLTGTAIALTVGAVASGAKYIAEAHSANRTDLVAPLSRIVRQRAPDGAIALLGMRTLVYPAFPLVNETGARWSLRHNALWFLPGLYVKELAGPSADVPYRAPAQMSPLERSFFEEIVADLCRTPPDLLMIEQPAHHAPAGRRALDLTGYYGQDSRFARLFSGYTQITTVPPFMVFERLERRGCE